ncbi:HNH endonuclease [Clostridium tetani]|uniref:HNH endonuclease n=1 Tax=Clostridium tetani TaxID=1513 RepID=UPI002953D3AB|nr:HNH endonuclease [Clostridium tetani]
MQLCEYGCFLEATPFSKYDKNEIIKSDEFAIVITRDNRYRINGKYIIDIEDVPKVENIRRRPDSKGYAHNNSNKNKTIYMHRIIMDCNEGFVDHINKNKYDNRKQNLRMVTSQENSFNSSKRKDNASGVVGVSYSKRLNKWRSRIVINYKEKHLPTSSSFDEAVKARLKGEALYFKTYSPNYNPKTNTIQLDYFSHDIGEHMFIEKVARTLVTSVMS